MNSNVCAHSEAIARELHARYDAAMCSDALCGQSCARWEQLSEAEQQAWLCVADKALAIICNHALEDLQGYFEISAFTANGWKKVLYWAGGIILAGLIGGGAVSLTGCGTTANFSLSSDQGMLSISRSPVGVFVVSAVPPVVQASKK